jgi:hypothetical protein
MERRETKDFKLKGIYGEFKFPATHSSGLVGLGKKPKFYEKSIFMDNNPSGRFARFLRANNIEFNLYNPSILELSELLVSIEDRELVFTETVYEVNA